MKPIIAVVGHTDLNKFNMPATSIPTAYTHAVEKAGGVPIILPFTPDLDILPAMAASVRGFLFTGGKDMDPDFFHQAPVPELGEMDTALDRFQLGVLDLAMTLKLPVLAICRGLQVVNVALGGNLFQDIYTQAPGPVRRHTQDVISFDNDHDITIVPGSRLHKMFGDRIPVNSRHHQAIDRLGKGLVITARASDGIIEAAEHQTLPMDLVQWHPELMLRKNDAMLPLFQSFVDTCQNLA
ncbi:MAG: gamma-glutamyl-gamma-aminobutyrate hydrolase family protein [Desulfobacteraceae bacterium]|nr:gamma-glutamyl-gamma-aminobutyrate hydrolase family protein [Desulfobacteraceae bacterium]